MKDGHETRYAVCDSPTLGPTAASSKLFKIQSLPAFFVTRPSRSQTEVITACTTKAY